MCIGMQTCGVTIVLFKVGVTSSTDIFFQLVCHTCDINLRKKNEIF